MPPSSRPRSLRRLEMLVVAHVGIFVIAATWFFGGNAQFIRPWLSLWGTVGALITAASVLMSQRRTQVSRRPLIWLGPFVLFNALVLASCFSPLLREVRAGERVFLALQRVPAWQPAAAPPGAAWRGLWLFDGIYLSCFNLALVIRHRRGLRALLLAAAANALVLSIFGTLQKLLHAKGLFFGTVKSPQIYFFASFIYHNHWGAFIVLMTAICLGLVRHYAQWGGGRDFFHTPAFGGLIAVLFMAITVPLSTSRSCSLLLVLLLGGACIHWLALQTRERREYRESAAPALLGALAAIVLGVAGVWFIAHEAIESRVAKTEEQIADMRARGSVGSRAVLYRDTWRMARARPIFGWGMDSYPYVFQLFNSQDHPNPLDHLPNYYVDAHSDWLQAVAEHGLVGGAVLALCALAPFSVLRHRRPLGVIPLYLLAGCGLIVLYAWVEFPFGNTAVVLCWWLCFFSAISYARMGVRRNRTERS
jgi:O-antigen ligase